MGRENAGLQGIAGGAIVTRRRETASRPYAEWGTGHITSIAQKSKGKSGVGATWPGYSVHKSGLTERRPAAAPGE